jgi:heme/copper-type cytochrome/quinol oxidase subunit 2
MRPSIPKIIYTALFFFTPFLYAQKPTHSPNPQDNTPIDFTNLFDVIVFIVLPILMFIFYFLWRKQVNKNRGNKD